MIDNNEKIIKDAQFRKGLSIAFFNANNAAITLVSTDKEYYTEDELKKKIIEYRDWFLKEHQNYYSTVISPIGLLFNKEETIKLVEGASGLEDLKDIWLSISQDERSDVDIIKVKDEMKKKYENI